MSDEGCHRFVCLPRLFLARALLQQVNHAIQIGISRAKRPREPCPTPRGDAFAIGNYFKLPRLAMPGLGCNAEALLDEGNETRDLGLVIRSSWTGNYFDIHCVLESLALGAGSLDRRISKL
jgi:hypothetical protein